MLAWLMCLIHGHQWHRYFTTAEMRYMKVVCHRCGRVHLEAL